MFKFTTACVQAATCVAIMATTAYAEQIKLTAASSHPPFLPWVEVITKHVVPETNARLAAMGSENEVLWTEAYAGALFNAPNALEGVEGGLADIAWVGTIFEPAKLPLQNVHFYAPFAVGDVHALTEIGNELHANLPIMNEQWDKNNQRFLGAMADGSYHLITREPINSMEDLQGLKLLAGGAVATWLDGTGATAVNGAFPEFYNSISTGIADGAVMTVNGMLPFKIHEVAPYITLVDMGGPITGALTVNNDTWNSLPKDVQGVLTELGGEYSTMVADSVAAREKTFLGIMEGEGAKISTFDAAERQKWADTLPDLAGDWVALNEASGLPAGKVLKAFLEGARSRGFEPLRTWGE
ncbi:MAG: C4-dicarboxylate TRAP transporter substrate-binding protein [Pacificibacter sp.]|jgi:TRAP-type C4-dicarboxylate transport system substrate-binding protein